MYYIPKTSFVIDHDNIAEYYDTCIDIGCKPLLSDDPDAPPNQYIGVSGWEEGYRCNGNRHSLGIGVLPKEENPVCLHGKSGYPGTHCCKSEMESRIRYSLFYLQ